MGTIQEDLKEISKKIIEYGDLDNCHAAIQNVYNFVPEFQTDAIFNRWFPTICRIQLCKYEMDKKENPMRYFARKLERERSSRG